jgi:hypothetical protein
MLGRLATRLLFILCFAVVIRVGGMLSPHRAKPGPHMVAVTDRFGDTHMVAAGLEPDDGEDPTSPEMRAALARVRLHSAGWSSGSEARLTFGAGGPDPVVVTPSELAAAREDLRRLNDTIEDQYDRVKEEERPEHVSFRPGAPMIDPTPQR